MSIHTCHASPNVTIEPLCSFLGPWCYNMSCQSLCFIELATVHDHRVAQLPTVVVIAD